MNDLYISMTFRLNIMNIFYLNSPLKLFCMPMCITYGGIVNTTEIMRLADWFNVGGSGTKRTSLPRTACSSTNPISYHFSFPGSMVW